jgi:lipopolysaccharide cholinephosphotransferase
MKKNMWLKRFSFEALKSQFIEIIDLLNKKEVPYFVDCGALLGIVRDGDLLPWDNDTDLAINAEDEAKLTAVVDEIRSLGWHCTFSNFSENNDFATREDRRVLKISDTWLGLFRGPTRMDIFLLYPMGEFRCWSAAQRYMRVDRNYFDGCDKIEWKGRELRVPKNYTAYLTEKYGDWSVTVKNWSCKGELTIFGAETKVKGPIIVDQSNKT